MEKRAHLLAGTISSLWITPADEIIIESSGGPMSGLCWTAKLAMVGSESSYILPSLSKFPVSLLIVP